MKEMKDGKKKKKRKISKTVTHKVTKNSNYKDHE